VNAFTINDFHDRIKIVATSVVETERNTPDPRELPDTWPITLSEKDYPLYDFLQFGGPVDDAPGLNQLVEQLFPFDGIKLGELGLRMMNLINNKFTYRPGVTNFSSPICETLDHGSGVCQDFTHLMIGIARSMKIPARYVSGLLHPQAERFRGYTQTHAWVELYFPSRGWVGFDPTNVCGIGENYISVAFGRDYRDIPPNKGIYRGNASESIEAVVHSELLTTIPPELATDRMHQLNVPTYPGRAYAVPRSVGAAARVAATHQQDPAVHGSASRRPPLRAKHAAAARPSPRRGGTRVPRSIGPATQPTAQGHHVQREPPDPRTHVQQSDGRRCVSGIRRRPARHTARSAGPARPPPTIDARYPPSLLRRPAPAEHGLRAPAAAPCRAAAPSTASHRSPGDLPPAHTAHPPPPHRSTSSCALPQRPKHICMIAAGGVAPAPAAPATARADEDDHRNEPKPSHDGGASPGARAKVFRALALPGSQGPRRSARTTRT
jgi:hypothetical protein